MEKVLLVDDDPFILDIYSMQLKKDGYSVDVANSAEKAFEKINSNCPDLLVLDLNLDAKNPGPKDGINILKSLRQDPKTKNLKVVVMSNYNDKDYAELSDLAYLGVEKVFLKIQNTPEELSKSLKEIFK